MKKLMMVSKASDLLGVHPATIRVWERTGKITGCIRTPGGHRRVPVSEVERLLGRKLSAEELGNAQSV